VVLVRFVFTTHGGDGDECPGAEPDGQDGDIVPLVVAGGEPAHPIGAGRHRHRIVMVAEAAARVPKAWTAGLLAGLGVVLFGTSALLLKAGATSWDARLFQILNEVPPAAASVLTQWLP
jgi:hypothetical protein